MYRASRLRGRDVAELPRRNYSLTSRELAMGIGRSVLRGLKDRVLSRYGEKIVSNLGDTSSDAPNKFSEPKRNLYEEMEKEGRIEKKPGSDR